MFNQFADVQNQINKTTRTNKSINIEQPYSQSNSQNNSQVVEPI